MENLNNDVKKALEVVKNKTGAFRELNILENYDSFEYSNSGKTAEIYSKDGNGFQVVVKPFSKYKIGDITN